MSEHPPGGKPTYGSAIRVAQIVHWLHQFPYGMGLQELATRLGISDRTLARYIQTLKESFFDDEGEPLIEVLRSGTQGRLRFRRKGIKMKGVAYELMSLYLALDLMAFLEGTFLQEGAQEVLDRMQQIMRREHGNETNLVLKDFHKKFYHWIEAPKDYSAHNANLDRVVKALVLQRKIELVYQSPRKPEKTHRVSPLSLLMYKRALYVIGRRETTPGQDLTFAVERIKTVSILEDPFFYPEDYEPGERFRGTFGLVRETEPEAVKLMFHPTVAQNVVSRRWHPSQETEWTDNGELIMTFRIEPGLEFQGWLLGYGHFVRVLEPPHLRQRVVDRLRQSLNQYEQDGWCLDHKT